MGFVCTGIIHVSNSAFPVNTFTSANFFESLHAITTVKLHLHQPHVTGKVHGYLHVFLLSKR